MLHPQFFLISSIPKKTATLLLPLLAGYSSYDKYFNADLRVKGMYMLSLNIYGLFVFPHFNVQKILIFFLLKKQNFSKYFLPDQLYYSIPICFHQSHVNLPLFSSVINPSILVWRGC